MFIVVADTEVEGQPRSDTIIVLREASQKVVALVLALTIEGEKIRLAQKEVGHRVAAILAVETECSVIEGRIAGAEANRVPLSPEFPGTFASDPCHRIVEVVGPV